MRLLLVLAVALAAVPSALAAAHPGEVGPPQRVVVVAGKAETFTFPGLRARACGPRRGCPNGAGGVSLVRFLRGARPPAQGTATVLTDTRCRPDRFGVSHCLNRLRLADGRELLVRHDHDMSAFPCLAPGDRVLVTTAAAVERSQPR